MKTIKKMGTALLLVAPLFIPGWIYAGCTSVWTNPSLHEELNDGDTVHTAMCPCLSSDGLTIYFNRYLTDLGYDYIVRAHRDSPDGPFTSMRTLTELHTIGYDTRTPWISHDKLRLYYTEVSYGGVAKIKMAATPEPNSVWTPVTIFDELNEGGYDAVSPVLTADELIIVFHSEFRPGSAGARDLWTATRTEPNGVFGNITALDGINSSTDESNPYILPDGLTIYFTRKDAGPDWNIYKATRASREEPFGDIQYIGLNTTPM